MRVLVLGSGVVGTASAWFLRAAGHEVTVLERQPGVALETSRANGGQVSVSHSEPWANPGAPLKILKWLGKDDAPLLFRLRPELRQWLWGLAFLRECLPHRTARNIRRLVALGLHSRQMLAELREGLNLDYDRRGGGILHFYTNARDFKSSMRSVRLMGELGCSRRSLTADEAVALEPALAPVRAQLAGADFCAEDESGDAHRFSEQLAARAAAAGVHFLFSTTVTRLITIGGRLTAVEALGADGWPVRHSADAVVVALGVQSVALLAPLGIRPRIYPAKGYSATFEVTEPAAAPTLSLTDDECKLVFSRLGDTLRVAGTAELAGHRRDLNLVRCETLTRRVAALFPGACDYARPRYWTGMRPMTPSNVPYIGASPIRGLYLNTGHGTLGWTLAAGSGHLIADIVSGRPAAVPWPDITG
ncbi:MAG: D-amino acid dehydrogenase [Burkholderiaceae bacterium]